MIEIHEYTERIQHVIKEDLDNLHFDEEEVLKKFLLENTEIITRKQFKKKIEIIGEGDSGEYIFFVADGFVKLLIERFNRRLLIKILKPGDFIGLALLSDLENYPYSLVPVTDSILYLIDKNAFKEKAYNDIYIMKSSLRIITDLLNNLYSKLISFRFKYMNGRVADALLYFSEEIFKSSKFEMPLNNKQLGDFANLSEENAIRVLKSLEKGKIIIKNGKKIEILNKKELINISRKG